MASAAPLQPTEERVTTFEQVNQNIKEAAVASLSRGAEIVAERARQRAPVRKIFSGGTGRIRWRTAAEVESDRSIRKALGLGPETMKPASMKARPGSPRAGGYARSVVIPNTANTGVDEMRAINPRRRGLNRLIHPEAAQALSRRGRYEVRSRRADFNRMVGGRLRGEITAIPAALRGNRIEARVISPTPYAKFQEFGTRHHPAHPFLRPALRESRSQVLSDLKSSIRGAIRQSGKIEVRVEMNVGGQ